MVTFTQPAVLLTLALSFFSTSAEAKREPKITVLNQVCYDPQLNVCRGHNAKGDIHSVVQEIASRLPKDDPRREYLEILYIKKRPTYEEDPVADKAFIEFRRKWHNAPIDFSTQLAADDGLLDPPIEEEEEVDDEPYDDTLEKLNINFYEDNCCPTGWDCLNSKYNQKLTFCFKDNVILWSELYGADIPSAKLDLVTFNYTRRDGAIINLADHALRKGYNTYSPVSVDGNTPSTTMPPHGSSTNLPHPNTTTRGNLSITASTPTMSHPVTYISYSHSPTGTTAPEENSAPERGEILGGGASWGNMVVKLIAGAVGALFVL